MLAGEMDCTAVPTKEPLPSSLLSSFAYSPLCWNKGRKPLAGGMMYGRGSDLAWSLRTASECITTLCRWVGSCTSWVGHPKSRYVKLSSGTRKPLSGGRNRSGLLSKKVAEAAQNHLVCGRGWL